VDETSVFLVPRSNYTYALKGSKKVRAIGVGHEKNQITATIAITEAGQVLPTHIIFQGKTDRCLPNGQPPSDIVWDYTDSHWQTPESYLRWIDRVLIPYKEKTIKEKSLNSDSWMILKHDLHYSHKDKKVLEYLNAHNIATVFVPAGCTDLLQECDTVVNKPFKDALKKAFTAHMHSELSKHLSSEGSNPTNFKPDLSMSKLKPLISLWIHQATKTLSTPEMKETIKKAFVRDGLMSEIRSDSKKLQFLNKTLSDMQPLLDRLCIGEERQNHASEDSDEEVNDDDMCDFVDDCSSIVHEDINIVAIHPDGEFTNTQELCNRCKNYTNCGYFENNKPYCYDCFFIEPQ
jgi:hypothetical protein